jgi:hypothetical protein
VIAVAVAVVLVLALPAAPAGAHSGGRAQLYVDSVRLEPQAGGWRAALVVRDADSGRPEPGFAVEITASGPGGAAVGPVGLADPGADGHYGALVPMTEGGWAVTVEANEIAGGPRAVPFRRTWPVTLQAGQALDLAGSQPSSPPGKSAGPSAMPFVLRLMAASVLAGLVSLWLARRRCSPNLR